LTKLSEALGDLAELTAFYRPLLALEIHDALANISDGFVLVKNLGSALWINVFPAGIACPRSIGNS
jgi:hypothetical protein